VLHLVEEVQRVQKKTPPPPPPPPPKKPEDTSKFNQWMDKAGTIMKGEGTKSEASEPPSTPITPSSSSTSTGPQKPFKERQYPIGQRAEEHRQPNPNVKIPLKLRGIPGTYASLLFERAMVNKQLDQITKDISSIQNLIKTNKKISAGVFGDPSIPKDKRIQYMSKISQQIRASTITSSFLETLIHNRRLPEANDIFSDFQQLVRAEKKIVEGTIVTAVPLNDSELSQIKDAIKEQYLMDTSANLLLSHEIDPTIVGGYILKVSGFVFDHSRVAQIEKYENKVIQLSKETKQKEDTMIRKFREEEKLAEARLSKS